MSTSEVGERNVKPLLGRRGSAAVFGDSLMIDADMAELVIGVLIVFALWIFVEFKQP